MGEGTEVVNLPVGVWTPDKHFRRHDRTGASAHRTLLVRIGCTGAMATD